MSARRSCSRLFLLSVLVAAGCIGEPDSGSQADVGDNSPSAVFATGPLPDLVVTTTNNPPSNASIGGTLSVGETVTNQGSADAGASYTKYYLSSNGTTPQYLLGNRAVSALVVGASDTGGTTGSVPSGVPQGSYRLLACADSGPGTSGRFSQVTESDENNNCTASAGSVAIDGPDLTESNVSATLTNNTLTVSDTVNNIGNGAAAASQTRWFLSTDNVKDPSDAFIRNCINGNPIPGRSVGTISAGGSSAGSASTSPLCVRDSSGLHPAAGGTYYIIACADNGTVVPELDENNNCTASSNTVTVANNIDLLETAVSNPPTSGTVGTQFTITDTVQNIGGDSAPSSFTKFYLSNNGVFLSAYLGVRSVGALTTTATDTATTTLTVQAGTPSGTYFVVACADSGPGTSGRVSQIAETNENNNCKSSTGTISLGSADLVITSLSNPPATASVGGTFTITDTTSNIGANGAGPFFNKYYLSINGISPSGALPGAGWLGTSPQFSAMASGANQTLSTTATVAAGTPPGTYYLLGCADAGPGTAGRTSQVTESNENNNCVAAGTQITVN